ncbi:MAG: helix-turn-helix domain-containing protein [Gemmatimonadaceae bacterium]
MPNEAAALRRPPTPAVVPLAIAAYIARDRLRGPLRAAFPRRRCHLALARSAADFARQFQTALVDAAIVDLGSPNEETWRAAELAREYPSVPFFALTPLRAQDLAVLARCMALDFADFFTEHVDDACMLPLVAPRTFTQRFERALRVPPADLALDTPVRRAVWEQVVAYAGRTVRTGHVAAAIGVSREHLSRSYASNGSSNLKRTIDLVRLIAAAELAKNPGYDVADVARILGFASASHLSTATQRICGTKSASLARLRAVDIVQRFIQGRARSRA